MDYFLADIMANGQKKYQVAIDTEESSLVNWRQVGWGVKEYGCGWCERGWEKIHSRTVEEFGNVGSLI